MDKNAIRAQMPMLVAGHVPSNCRNFSMRIYDGEPVSSALGFHVDPQPFEGKVIVATDAAIVVKMGRATFAVLDRTLVTAVPEIGAKVHVEPYARRRFDGQRADTPEPSTERTCDGVPYTVTTILLGDAPAKLPVPTPRCPELLELIGQIEKLPAPDRFRRLSHLLVDAGAKDFTWVDPLPHNIVNTPPAIGFTVDTAKFRGRVTVIYDRGFDYYSVVLAGTDGQSINRVDHIDFSSLGTVLEDLIDDGSWRRIRVQCTSARKPARH